MLDSFTYNSHPCLVFDFLPGGDLYSYLTSNNNTT
jgi:dual specificity protein kinase YAK1